MLNRASKRSLHRMDALHERDAAAQREHRNRDDKRPKVQLFTKTERVLNSRRLLRLAHTV